ncbi:macro domain-containing protein [Pedobacter polysacchareus]|uniref:macro domain-containing protein n=1 Tax=Pedobacter polysacchareus TaxID=2861973 RepID=UPI001C9A202E|nr:macro domain-containing protein [Pedobacter polysacchareus]
MEIIKSGNIFDSEAQTLVNTVNCMGAMGKGLALQFKIRYPDMFMAYEQICMNKLLDIGKLWLYKTDQHWILNFPTKYDWRYPSKVYFLEKGLDKFMQTYQQRNIESIAFPLLGASNGGIAPEASLRIMTTYLQHCTIPVTIYLQYQPIENKLF